LFLSFEWVKLNFTTFRPPGNIFLTTIEKSSVNLSGKNPSDAHGRQPFFECTVGECCSIDEFAKRLLEEAAHQSDYIVL